MEYILFALWISVMLIVAFKVLTARKALRKTLKARK